MTATRPTANPVMVALYAGVATALAALATALLFQAENIVLTVIAFLLIGVAPVVGYQLGAGRLGSDWKPLIGGLLGFILLILGWILWPILVGVMTRGQSVGKLFVASLIGIILGIVVFLIAASAMGQNPSWIGAGFILLWSVWGGTVGTAMSSWGES
jgi:hypothetical protein